jgi:hypothetical protein
MVLNNNPEVENDPIGDRRVAMFHAMGLDA